MMSGEVLASQLRSTTCGGAEVPTPVSDSVVGEFEASLANEAVSVAVPLSCGVKVTLKFALLPAAIVRGSVMPVILYSEVFTDAELTVTLAPDAVNFPDMLLLVPTVTFPKFRLVGDTAKVPADVPVPVRLITNFERPLRELSVRFPLTAPLAWGAKTRLNVKLSPEAMKRGKVSQVAEKPAPVKLL